jgi:hypothetical protein
LLYPLILQFIIEAEATEKTGTEKLRYVIEHIQEYAAKKGIELDLMYIKDLIEKIIIVTKKVNSKG